MNIETNSFILRLYFTSRKAFQKLIIFLNACFIGFWLGILSRNNLYSIDSVYYDTEKQYTNDKYNLRGFWTWETRVIEKHFQSCKSLLVAGVGGGREVLALRKMGYQTDGFECNPNLAEFANQFLKRQGFETNIEVVMRDRCSTTNKLYDGLIIGWGAYMLIQGRKHRIEFLKNMRKKTKYNAPILLSFFCHYQLRKYHYLIANIGNLFRVIFGRERIEPGDSLVPNYVHIFTKEEIAYELNEAGFELTEYCTQGYGHAVGIAR